jgi:hypothetical protein
MSITNFIFLQLIAHITADYLIQNEKESKDKNEKGFKSLYLKKHIFIVFLTSWLLSISINFIVGSIIIAFTHYLIDGFKPKFPKKYSFFIDQLLHIAIIFIVSLIYFFYFNSKIDFIINLEKPFIESIPAILLCYIFCTKPINIIIREIISAFNIEIGTNDDLPNAGKLIGITERFLILTFILMNQFEAVGFLLAAKSILRYKNDDGDGSNKTEYVLIGTLLSFSITLAIIMFVKIIPKFLY